MVRNVLSVDFLDFITDVQRALPMDHAAVENARDDAPLIFGHTQRDTLESNSIEHGNVSYFARPYQWFVGVSLKLDQSHSGHIARRVLHAIGVGFVRSTAIVARVLVVGRQFGSRRVVGQMRWRGANAIFRVNFLSDDVMCLQKSLGQTQTSPWRKCGSEQRETRRPISSRMRCSRALSVTIVRFLFLDCWSSAR